MQNTNACVLHFEPKKTMRTSPVHAKEMASPECRRIHASPTTSNGSKSARFAHAKRHNATVEHVNRRCQAEAPVGSNQHTTISCLLA